jgi:transposase-like protein
MMERKAYGKWLEEIGRLTNGQKAEALSLLEGRSSEEEAVLVIESRLMAERICTHCGTAGVICRGRANGLRRFYCSACRKTVNALTGTPLAHLHYKGRWLEFAQSLSAREVVRRSAKRCGIDPSTAFRWRHRFLAAIKTDAGQLKGIVEADETYVLESRKGARIWKKPDSAAPDEVPPNRKPRRRGGKASKRGLSREFVAVLVAADRSGTTVSAILPSVTIADVTDALRPVLEKDALLVTDRATFYPACAAMLGVSHERLHPAGGEHVRGELHIQTVNSRQSGIKDMLRRHRGVATKYLGSYLKWFHIAGIHQDPTPLACLNAAMGWR